MTVLETPSDGAGHYLIRLVADDKVTKSKLYLVLDPNDLSLLEMRSGRKIDPNDRNMQRFPGHNIQTISVYMAKLIFPVLSRPADASENGVEFLADNALASKSIVRDFEDSKALVVGIARSNGEGDDLQKRLDEDQYRYRVLWKRGDPWWTSQTWLPDGFYRVELVREDRNAPQAGDPNTAFLSLYSQMKNARESGDTVLAEEYDYRMIRLGKPAIPAKECTGQGWVMAMRFVREAL